MTYNKFVILVIGFLIILLNACISGALERSVEQAELDQLRDNVSTIEMYYSKYE